ncbi:hypothetical protein GCM10022200_19280 [Microbacterium awajiense]|uniref:Fluoride-specific ion channel FluC n=1 Tax=Microbacterium awajiense TaxID=415214 RepID=A0ABP7AMB0_9MICO
MSTRVSARTLALVVAGGAAGVGLRAALTMPFESAGAQAVVLATLSVNIVGSLLLGVVVGLLDDRHPSWRAFLGTGLMGGFTTYSAFAVQTAELLATDPAGALILAATALALGVSAGFGGVCIGRRIADEAGATEPMEDSE